MEIEKLNKMPTSKLKIEKWPNWNINIIFFSILRNNISEGRDCIFYKSICLSWGRGMFILGGGVWFSKIIWGGCLKDLPLRILLFLEHKFNFFLLIRCREIYKILGKYLSLIFCLGILSILQYIHASLRLINLFYLEAHFLYNISLKVFTQFQC